MAGIGGIWESHGQSHLSYVVQWDTKDRWDMVGGFPHLSYTVQWDRADKWDMVDPGGTGDSHRPSHLSYMVQWDRTDRWDMVGSGGTGDFPTCPTWYSGIGQTSGIWWGQVVRGIPTYIG